MLLTLDGKELLNSSEAAELLSERARQAPGSYTSGPYTKSAVWSMCRRGVLKPYRIEGHTYFYLKDDVMCVPINPNTGQRSHSKRGPHDNKLADKDIRKIVDAHLRSKLSSL